MRTAFSPIIYDVLDFAVAIYDRDKRLLSQAPGLPNFLGTMGYCVEGAVEAVGEDGLVDGDIILINYPYVTGLAPGGHGGRLPRLPERLASWSATRLSRPTSSTSGPRTTSARTPPTTSRRAPSSRG